MQSFHFLVDVAEYQELLKVTSGDEHIIDDFKRFVGIVKEYIKIGSNSEINIACRTKRILSNSANGPSGYASLCLVSGNQRTVSDSPMLQRSLVYGVYCFLCRRSTSLVWISLTREPLLCLGGLVFDSSHECMLPRGIRGVNVRW